MHHSNHNSKMMWMMMAGCLLLPIALLLFGGSGGGIGSNWGWFALIGAFVLVHILMMFGHGRDKPEEDAEKVQTDGKSNIHNH